MGHQRQKPSWQTICNISALQLSTNPTRHYRCFARSSPASSHFWATFCVRQLRLHLWSVCSLRVDCSCVQIEHACPSLCWKLRSSLNATVLFVCDVAQCNMTSLCSRIEHWRTVMSYSTDKICIQNLLLYTKHAFWFQLFVIALIFWHITFTTDLCWVSEM